MECRSLVGFASSPTAAEFRIAEIGGLFSFRSSGDWQWEQFMGDSPPLQGSERPASEPAPPRVLTLSDDGGGAPIDRRPTAEDHRQLQKPTRPSSQK
jgi:hypothetical protein